MKKCWFGGEFPQAYRREERNQRAGAAEGGVRVLSYRLLWLGGDPWMREQCLLRPQFLEPKTRYQKQSLGAQDHWGCTFHIAGPMSELRKQTNKQRLKNPRDHMEKWEPRFRLEKPQRVQVIDLWVGPKLGVWGAGLVVSSWLRATFQSRPRPECGGMPNAFEAG